MVQSLSLDERVLQDARRDSRDYVTKSIYSFEDAFQPFEGGSGKQLREVKDSYEDFLTYQFAFHKTLSMESDFSDGSSEALEFIKLYSIYAGASEAISSMEDSIRSEDVNGNLDVSHTNAKLRGLLTNAYVKSVKKKETSDDVRNFTKGFYKWMINETSAQSGRSSLEKYSKLSERIHIEGRNLTFNGLKQNYSEGSSLWVPTGTSLDDVVGNSEMKSALKGAVHNLMFYDIDKKVNIMDDDLGEGPKTFYFYGEPGQGKSFTLKAMLNYAHKLSNIADKPLEVKDFSDFKSKYYSESAQNIRNVFKEVGKGDKLYVLIAEDIESIFPARSTETGSNEDNSNIQVFMNQLEGTFSTQRGNWFLVATTNYPISSDDALPSRLREKFIKIEGPETESDYISLMQKRLESPINNGLVNVAEWDDIGKLCLEYDFTGRNVKNIAVDARDYITKKDENGEELLNHIGEDFKFDRSSYDSLKKSFRTLDKDKLVGLVKKKKRELDKAAEFQRKEAIRKEVERLRIRQDAMEELE